MKFISTLALLASLTWVANAADTCQDVWAHDTDHAVCSSGIGYAEGGWTNGRYGSSGCAACACQDCPTDAPVETQPPKPDPIPLPQKCIGHSASWSGDPHFKTFDRIHYDCQGEGEFHVLKSLDSAFEIQGRFKKFNDDKRPTVTKSVVWRTGDGMNTRIQVTAPDIPVDGSCHPHVFVNGLKMDVLTEDMGDNMIQVAKTTAGRGNRIQTGYVFYYHDSGFQITVLAKKSSVNGCVLNTKICLPDDWERSNERIVGLLGTPNDVASDDWMNTNNQPVTIPTTKEDLKFETAYNYCVDNWCIRDEADSIFHYESGTSHAGFLKCELPPDTVTENCVLNANDDLINVCGEGALACLVDGCAGGPEEAKNFITTEIDMLDEDCGREVYSENFDTEVSNSWGEIEQGGLDSKFLRLHQESPKVVKKFTVSPNSDSVRIEFMFYEIGQWEGAGDGRDWVHFFVNETPLNLLGFDDDINAANIPEYYEGFNKGLFWHRRAVSNATDMGFGSNTDQMHKITINIPKTYFEDGHLRIAILVSMTNDKINESAGIDDLRIIAHGEACDIAVGDWPEPEDVDIEAVELPQLCNAHVAMIWGDPHILTFDRLQYDCQGEGEFTVVKSLDTGGNSGFEVQGRFDKFDESVSTSVMRAVAVKEVGAPTLQLQVPDLPVGGKCPIDFHVNGERNDLTHGTQSSEVIVQELGETAAVIFYPKTKVQLLFLVHQSEAFGCFMSTKLCVPDEYRSGEKLIGLLGSADRNTDNEWMDAQGNAVSSTGKSMYFQDAHNYCTDNWCNNDETKSLFTYTNGASFAAYNKCNDAYIPGRRELLETCAKNPPDELVEVCGSNMPCIVDGCSGSLDDARNSLKYEKELMEEKGCSLSLMFQDFQNADASNWGAVGNANGQRYRSFSSADPSAGITLGQYNLPTVVDRLEITFLMYQLADWKGFCGISPETASACTYNKFSVYLNQEEIELDTFEKDGSEMILGGYQLGVHWYREILSANVHRFTVSVPKAHYGSSLTIGLHISTPHSYLVLGLDDFRVTGQAQYCRDMLEYYYAVSGINPGRQLMPVVSNTHPAASTGLTEHGRHLEYEVETDQCVCVCPDASGVGGGDPSAPSPPRVLNLYAGIDGNTCGPLGDIIGTVTVTPYLNGTATVVYAVENGYTLSETNLYSGDERLPGLADGAMLPPPEYPYSVTHESGTTTHTEMYDMLDCDFYVAAHAQVCGPFPATPEPTSPPTFPPTPNPTPNPTLAPVPDPTPAPVPDPTPAPVPATTPPDDATTTAEPPDDGTPTPPGGFGDPHIMTWDGDQYDFHGACDLVLLHNPDFANGLGMDIHIRTKIDTWWSYIETAVLRIGKDRFEVQGGEGLNYWFNDSPGRTNLSEKRALGRKLAGQYKIHFHQLNDRQHQFKIELNNGDAVIFKTFKEFVRVNVDTKSAYSKDFVSSVGLMGTYPSGLHKSRDNSTVVEDVNAFGNLWQVQPATEGMLFHNVDGPQHPQRQCTMPTMTEASRKKRRLSESMISQEDAELACARVSASDRDACVFDVLATNDKDMAGSY